MGCTFWGTRPFAGGRAGPPPNFRGRDFFIGDPALTVLRGLQLPFDPKSKSKPFDPKSKSKPFDPKSKSKPFDPRSKSKPFLTKDNFSDGSNLIDGRI
jgi:hypothetical protein